MITIQSFGLLPNGEGVNAYTLHAPNGMRATLLSYGATLQAFKLPNRQDIVLGFDNLEDYLGPHPYFGAAIGRVANRVEHASFEIDGQTFSVSANENQHALHGGPEGFDRQNWKAEVKQNALIFRHTSPDGHQGYPGTLDCEFEYTLDNEGLRLEMRAKTDVATPVCLTGHSYFNLGTPSIKDHALSLKSSQFYAVDNAGINQGEVSSVKETPLDFRASAKIRDSEIDHHFIVPGTGLRQMAQLFSPDGQHRLSVLSDYPGLQIYTAHKLELMRGKYGQPYAPHSGIAFEPQYPPNAINVPHMQDVILRPGQIWQKTILYKIESLETR